MDERYDESEYTRKRRQKDFYQNTYRDKIDKIVSGIKAMKE